jgi:Lrp/AsnC family transcriptional regulator, leucine-responsive regulatory protein
MPQKEIKLDSRDRQLMVELNFDARQTNAELAKKLRLSKKGVEYKISRLEKAGVIEGYYPLVNFPSLGFLYCRVLFKLQYMTEEKKEQIVNFIQQNPKMQWSIWARGIYDLVIGIWAESFTDFKAIVRTFIAGFESNVKESSLSLVTELNHLPYNFLSGKKDFQEFTIHETVSKEAIDGVDKLILRALAKNGRASLVELGGKAGINAKTVAYRLRSLREREVLLTTRASINHQLLGYTHFKVFLSLRTNAPDKIMQIKSFLKQQPPVIYLVDDIGISDLDVEMMFKSNEEFFGFVDEVQFKFPDLVRDYQYSIYTDTIKVSYLPFN